MKNLLSFKVIPNKGVRDVCFYYNNNYKYEIIVDSYHLILNYMKVKNFNISLRNALMKLFDYWLNTISISNYCFLPIDFSDQYISGFIINFIKHDHVCISYGANPKISSLDWDFMDYSNNSVFMSDIIVEDNFPENFVTKEDLIDSIQDLRKDIINRLS